MGFLDSVFGSNEEIKPNKLKSRPEQNAARGFLSGMMKQNFNTPTRKVAGMTDTEKAGQSMLSDWMGESNYNDPYSSAKYQSYRDLNRMDKEDTIDAVKRSGGNNNSSAAMIAEGRLRNRFDTQEKAELASLQQYEDQRSDQLTQAKVNAAASVGSIERQIENERNLAEYEAIMKELLMPYQYSAQIANTLLNDDYDWYTPSYMQTDGIMDYAREAGNTIGAYTTAFGIGNSNGDAGKAFSRQSQSHANAMKGAVNWLSEDPFI